MRRTVAVVGAGMAGIACARALADAGVAVSLFDKGRAPGGRVATRRDATGGFDHGAQFFTVREPDFAQAIKPLEAQALVAPWTPRVWDGRPPAPTSRAMEPWFVGVPGMRALPHALASGLGVRAAERVVGLQLGGGWTLTVERVAEDAAPHGEVGPFDVVVLALPAEQVVALPGLPASARARAAAAAMEPCLAVMGTFPGVEVAWDVARFANDALAWATREDSKPGRSGSNRWVLHSGPRWLASRMEVDPTVAGAELAEAFAVWARQAGGRGSLDGAAWTAHRWRYARLRTPRPPSSEAPAEAAWLDADASLGLCGDWLLASRVEDAWRSGRALAQQLLEHQSAEA